MKATAKNLQRLLMLATRKNLQKSFKLSREEKHVVKQIDKALITAVKHSYKNIGVDFNQFNLSSQELVRHIVSFYKVKREILCIPKTGFEGVYIFILVDITIKSS